MPDRSSSQTALAVAVLRAAHQLLDAEPKVLDDSVVMRLLGGEVARRILEHPERYRGAEAMALRSHVLARSRFAEDRLADAVRSGVRQYVVLGAGLDTFAFRQPLWAHALRVFEVDHPASQNAKLERLAAAGIAVPANVAFAPIDFEREALRDGLLRHGVKLHERVFLSWLGVMVYLTEDAIDLVFRTVAALPPGSEIAFTFAQPRSPGELRSDGRTSLAERALAAGEPWVSLFEPEALRAKLLGHGFSVVGFLSPDDTRARYFAGRADGLSPPRRTSIGSARV